MSSLFERNMVTLHLFDAPGDQKSVEIDLAALEDKDTVVFLNNLYRTEWNSGKMRWEATLLGRIHDERP